MNCPDCGKPTDDLHTCIEYERNRADELQKQLEIMHIELQMLRNRLTTMEGYQVAQTPWRKA